VLSVIDPAHGISDSYFGTLFRVPDGASHGGTYRSLNGVRSKELSWRHDGFITCDELVRTIQIAAVRGRSTKLRCCFAARRPRCVCRPFFAQIHGAGLSFPVQPDVMSRGRTRIVAGRFYCWTVSLLCGKCTSRTVLLFPATTNSIAAPGFKRSSLIPASLTPPLGPMNLVLASTVYVFCCRPF
jgi:hypothetical protein